MEGSRREEGDVQSRTSLLKTPYLLAVIPESRKRRTRRHQRVKEVLGPSVYSVCIHDRVSKKGPDDVRAG